MRRDRSGKDKASIGKDTERASGFRGPFFVAATHSHRRDPWGTPGDGPIVKIRSSGAKCDRRTRLLRLLVPAAFLACLLVLYLQKGSTVSVKLAWDPSPNPAVTGYKIYHSKSNWEQATVIDVGNRTEYTVTGLEAGVTYRFAATAYSKTGEESPLSKEVMYPPAQSP